MESRLQEPRLPVLDDAPVRERGCRRLQTRGCVSTWQIRNEVVLEPGEEADGRETQADPDRHGSVHQQRTNTSARQSERTVRGVCAQEEQRVIRALANPRGENLTYG